MVVDRKGSWKIKEIERSVVVNRAEEISVNGKWSFVIYLFAMHSTYLKIVNSYTGVRNML